MQLTTFSDYAMRTMIYVGVRSPELCTIDEIAESYGISRSHLTKIVPLLGEHGFLHNVRGLGGGLRLGRPPEEINLGELIRLTEKNLKLVECFEDPPENQAAGCRIQNSCLLHGILDSALNAFFAVLENHTLADLLKKRRALAREIGI